MEAEVRAILDAAVNVPERNFLLSLRCCGRCGWAGRELPPRTDQPRPVDVLQIIADTNVVSEFMRIPQTPSSWRGLGRSHRPVTICVVTVEEIERGLGRLPAGRRRQDLQNRWSGLVDAFADAVVVYDLTAARHTAAILVDAQAAGRPMSLADAQIAGICVAGGHELATRNVAPPATSGLTLINPFGQ